ncbi:tetratricopeptide repeat protein [Chitinophaga lutea]|uniref:Tetratricopeptide repeat protein n=1 Tax=Chitinophaga lutea TaxID=2488634 RepID=A0A3N4PYI2_9BACT|nr:tetratricopeptide repeat protein [Chitinophaga lutea]RPE13782.1 tetratricopeptide repeat protein [Chitinophaga lutea]
MKKMLLSAIAFLCAVTLLAQDNIDKALLMDYFQEQQYDKAINYLEETVKPQHPNGLALLANAYYQSGQLSQAEKNYHRVLELDSNHIAANQNLGIMARSQKNSARAIPYFEKLLQLRPDNAAYYKQLAYACSEAVGKADTAFYYMKQAHRLNPKDVNAVTFLGSEFIDRKNYAAADSVLKTYYAFDSSQVSVSYLLIRSAYQQKKFRDVTLYGEPLITRKELHPTALMFLSVSHYALKQYDSCIRVHDKIMVMAGAAPETVKYYAALSYAGKMRYDSSNVLLQECIEMAKSKALDGYYTALADNYEQMKQYKAAIAHYDTAYFLFHDPMRQYGIARIYDQHMQDPAKAKRFYQQFVKNAKPEGKDEINVHNYAKERIKNL